MRKIAILLLTIFGFFNISYSKLKIGVSILPYYSYVSNIVKDKADVVQIIPNNVDVHTYQPSSEDVKTISDLDVVVINGTGIDDYIKKIVKSSNNKDIKIINSSENVALLRVSGQRGSSKSVNTHTFISAQASIQQVNTIAKKLADIDKDNAKTYLANAREYTKKISRIKARKLREISKLKKEKKVVVATTHGGYDYLLGELGINIAVVVEPKNNTKPSANDLKYAIDTIKANNVNILFESEGISSPYSKQIQRETGIVVSKLSHMTNGKYTREAFEKDLEKNFDIIIQAIKNAK